jgi:hypothetical protein
MRDRHFPFIDHRRIVPVLSLDPRRAAVAYLGTSLASLLLGVPLLLATGIIGLFLCSALGPIGLLFHIGLMYRLETLSVSNGLDVLITYLAATAILAGCFFLARNRRIALRVMAYLVGGIVWLACAYLNFIALIYSA